jgi:NADH-quinone oxidoreductase subunit M
MPIFVTIFIIASLGNMGFPGTSNFLGELALFLGIFTANSALLLLAATSIVFSAIYSI